MKARIFFLAFVALMISISAFGEEINGLRYSFNLSTKEAMVLQHDFNKPYTGDVVIPETVEHLGVEYRVTSIVSGAFLDCSGLTSVVIPNSVTSIGKMAFYECSGLTSVTIPNSMTSINMEVFWGCSGLTSVTIPGSVMRIGWGAFYNCKGLTTVTIPNSVTTIDGAAFDNCTDLTSVTIGSGIKTLGYLAFAKCSKLADVYCYAENVPDMLNEYGEPVTNAFDDTNISTAKLHVPASALNAYKTTEPWSGFGSIEALTDEELALAVDALHGEGFMEQAPIYDLGGRRLSTLKKGINIMNGKKVLVK